MRFVQGLNTMRPCKHSHNPTASCKLLSNAQHIPYITNDEKCISAYSMGVSTSTVNRIVHIKPAQQGTRSWPKTDIAEQAPGRSDGNPTHLDL